MFSSLIAAFIQEAINWEFGFLTILRPKRGFPKEASTSNDASFGFAGGVGYFIINSLL